MSDRSHASDSRVQPCCPATLELIAGFEKVIDLLGYWPCFHDGTLLTLILTTDKENPGLAVIEITAQVHRMLREVDDRGFFKTCDHALIRMKFDRARIDEIQLQMFPVHIYECSIVGSSDSHCRLEVTLQTEGIIHFSCAAASVEEIRRSAP